MVIKWLSPAVVLLLYQCSLTLGAPSVSNAATASQAQSTASAISVAETATEPALSAEIEPMEENFDADDDFPYSSKDADDDFPYSMETSGDFDEDADDFFEDEGVHPVVLEDGKVMVPKMTWEVVDPSAEPAGDGEVSAETSDEDGAAARRLHGFLGRHGRRLSEKDEEEHEQTGTTEEENENPDQMEESGADLKCSFVLIVQSTESCTDTVGVGGALGAGATGLGAALGAGAGAAAAGGGEAGGGGAVAGMAAAGEEAEAGAAA
uniref:Uncharacterized protein n=1 Tax=Chromera velia CCMP2878 TaxID=1169474 RepID=A0A0G4FMA5_9ALVE|eukprot:Cvel_17726.t1-p1 / transcript=Cvel_17726.t1 / gene=Cvel_17726 / organism=Chromera_velia_CCMP2878 / gene_product=hypothetical protein / transcript_product=hypothetical protein / location=Cvel_scaffold1431:44539-46214(+) / protein_length=264 / sequence_SO=supercontig / SO=protein_coding / is_pseudo=false